MFKFEFEAREDGFDFRRCVTSGQTFRWREVAPGHWNGVDGDTWYVVREGQSRLHVESNFDQSRFERLFRLDLDARMIETEILRSGPELRGLLQDRRGLRILRQSRREEVFYGFLCSANNHLQRIAGMVAKLAAIGPKIEGALFEARSFPTSKSIARLGESKMRELGFGYRAATISRCAEALGENGESWLAELAEDGYDSAWRSLTRLPGIGRKLADCICLFALDYPEAVPVDTHVWAALTELYHPDWRGLALSELRYATASDRFRERFGKNAGWAHQYLFVNRADLHRKGGLDQVWSKKTC